MSQPQFEHDPKKWRLPTLDEMKRFLISRQTRPKPSRFISNSQLSPVELYCYLKSRFGPPNGMMMSVRTPTSDNLIQWHFTVQDSTGTFIDFIGMNDRTEILLHGSFEIDEMFWSALVGRIQNDMTACRKEWKSELASLEKWYQFINPYRRFRTMTEKLKKRLVGLNLTPPEPALNSFTSAEAQAHWKRFQAWIEALSEAALLGTSIRVVAPILAEAFINLIYFLLAKPEVRSDERLYDNFVRSQIDVRVRSLHLYCNGFTTAVDVQDIRFKDFHTLMNSRNDFLHGNVDPKKMKFGEVYFDGKVPLFKEDKSYIARWNENSQVGVERDRALKDLVVVDQFIELVTGAIEKKYKREIEMVLAEEQLGWREDTKRVGILFGSLLGEIHAVTKLD